MTVREHPKSSLTAWERWELASFDPNAGGGEHAESPAEAEELQALREQAARAGHEEGYAAGHAEGLAQGLAAGEAQAEAMGREEALGLARTADALGACIAELNDAVAAELLALSLEVARQLVRQTIAARPEVILGAIREALEQFPLQHASIRLNPEDASLVRLRAGDQLTHAGHRIHEDAKLARGDVVVEAGGSHIDATLSARWRRIVDSLGQAAPWVDPAEK